MRCSAYKGELDNGLAKVSLDIFQSLVRALVIHEVDGAADTSKATRATNAVQVGLVIGAAFFDRKVQVDDQ